MYYMHEMVNQSQSGLPQSCLSLQVQKLKEEVTHLKAKLAASAREVSNHHYNYITTAPIILYKLCHQAVSLIRAGGKSELAACPN